MANTNSLLLNGTNQSLSIADASQTGLDITGDLTLEVWYKLDAAIPDNTYHSLVSKFTSGGNYSYRWMMNKVGGVGVLSLTISSDGSNQDEATIAYTPNVDEWTHLAITFDASGSLTEFFENGVSLGTDTGSLTSIYNCNAPFQIGVNNNLTNFFFDGGLDDVRVWNDIRTDAEIADNYQKELVGNEAGLVGYWKVNNSLLDETSNDNDLTNNNSATFPADPAFVEPTAFSATISEVLNLSEAITKPFGRFVTITETLSMTEAKSRLSSFGKTISETLSLSEIVSRLSVWTKTISDTLSLSDVISLARTYVASILETLNISDTISRLTQFKKTISEALSLSDVVTVVKGFLITISETLNLSGTVTRISKFVTTITETLSLTTTLTTARTLWKWAIKNTSSWTWKDKK